jgi:hypothetical protein
MRQHRCIPGIAPGDLNGLDFQRLIINADVDLAPNAPFGATMLARVSLAFPFDLNPCAVDKQVQRAVRTAIRHVHYKIPLMAAEDAEVRDVPIESRQPKQAFHKARRLT